MVGTAAHSKWAVPDVAQKPVGLVWLDLPFSKGILSHEFSRQMILTSTSTMKAELWTNQNLFGGLNLSCYGLFPSEALTPNFRAPPQSLYELSSCEKPTRRRDLGLIPTLHPKSLFHTGLLIEFSRCGDATTRLS